MRSMGYSGWRQRTVLTMTAAMLMVGGAGCGVGPELETVADVPFHAGVPGEVSGRQRRQGLNPASSAAAAQA